MFKVRGLMAVQGSNVQKFKGRLSDVPAVPMVPDVSTSLVGSSWIKKAMLWLAP